MGGKGKGKGKGKTKGKVKGKFSKDKPAPKVAPKAASADGDDEAAEAAPAAPVPKGGRPRNRRRQKQEEAESSLPAVKESKPEGHYTTVVSLIGELTPPHGNALFSQYDVRHDQFVGDQGHQFCGTIPKACPAYRVSIPTGHT